MIMLSPTPLATSSSTGARLVAADGRELPLRAVELRVEAGGGIARTVLTQRFANPFAQPLEVRYLLPLPADGAVSGFAFVLGDVRVAGEVTGKQQARARFEQALVQGKTAALLEQERTSLFTQRVGNVPPGEEVVAEVTVDQPLRWLEEGAWELRFPTVVGPRYLGAPGRVADASRITAPVLAGGASEPALRAHLSMTILDALQGPVESPSHAVEAGGAASIGALRATTVRFERDQGVQLDRDVVVRWPVALPDVSANLLAARPLTAAHDGHAFALVTVAPPTSGGAAVPRDLTFLIDTSGSMSGRPLDQARRVCAAMIETLGVNDRVELIEFGSRPRRWKDEPQRATDANKSAALAWLRALEAAGSTEMHRAVLEALRPLRPESQRQVVLVTDGYIGFEQEIVRALLEGLPAGARLHTVGVGSSVNRSLTQAAARAGRGTELLVGIDEDPDRLVGRLLARTAAPLVTDLEVEADGLVEVAPRKLPDLYAEAPALVALRLAKGGGRVVLRGRTAEGMFVQTLTVPALEPGEGPRGIAALFAREKVEDTETRLTAGGDARELNRTIESTGVEFQISTRLTSWVAVSAKVTVDVSAKKKQVEQPHQLPHGVSAEGLGLRTKTEEQKKEATKTGVRYVDFLEAARRLNVDEEELKRLVSNAELRGFRAGESMKFKADDVEALRSGRETEPTISLTDSDEEKGIAQSSDELILEDSTSDTVINLGDIMGGAVSGSQQEVIFDTTEERTIEPADERSKTGEHAAIDDDAPDQPKTISKEEASSIIRRITTKRILPPEEVEVPGVSEELGVSAVARESDAALVEVGPDEPMETEAFELMDESGETDRTEAAAKPMIGPYEVVRVLGRGGMGMVYEVRGPDGERLVARTGIDGEPNVTPYDPGPLTRDGSWLPGDELEREQLRERAAGRLTRDGAAIGGSFGHPRRLEPAQPGPAKARRSLAVPLAGPQWRLQLLLLAVLLLVLAALAVLRLGGPIGGSGTSGPDRPAPPGAGERAPR